MDELIHCEWLLRRYRAAETQMWQYQNDSKYREPEKYPLGHAASQNPDTFSKLQYRVDATRRAYQRSLQALKQLQADAAAAPPPPPSAEPAGLPSPAPSFQTTSPLIGFVPANPIPAQPQPAPADPGDILIPLTPNPHSITDINARISF